MLPDTLAVQTFYEILHTRHTISAPTFALPLVVFSICKLRVLAALVTKTPEAWRYPVAVDVPVKFVDVVPEPLRMSRPNVPPPVILCHDVFSCVPAAEEAVMANFIPAFVDEEMFPEISNPHVVLAGNDALTHPVTSVSVVLPVEKLLPSPSQCQNPPCAVEVWLCVAFVKSPIVGVVSVALLSVSAFA